MSGVDAPLSAAGGTDRGGSGEAAGGHGEAARRLLERRCRDRAPGPA